MFNLQYFSMYELNFVFLKKFVLEHLEIKRISHEILFSTDKKHCLYYTIV